MWETSPSFTNFLSQIFPPSQKHHLLYCTLHGRDFSQIESFIKLYCHLGIQLKTNAINQIVYLEIPKNVTVVFSGNLLNSKSSDERIIKLLRNTFLYYLSKNLNQDQIVYVVGFSGVKKEGFTTGVMLELLRYGKLFYTQGEVLVTHLETPENWLLPNGQLPSNMQHFCAEWNQAWCNSLPVLNRSHGIGDYSLELKLSLPVVKSKFQNKDLLQQSGIQCILTGKKEDRTVGVQSFAECFTHEELTRVDMVTVKSCEDKTLEIEVTVIVLNGISQLVLKNEGSLPRYLKALEQKTDTRTELALNLFASELYEHANNNHLDYSKLETDHKEQYISLLHGRLADPLWTMPVRDKIELKYVDAQKNFLCEKIKERLKPEAHKKDSKFKSS